MGVVNQLGQFVDRIVDFFFIQVAENKDLRFRTGILESLGGVVIAVAAWKYGNHHLHLVSFGRMQFAAHHLGILGFHLRHVFAVDFHFRIDGLIGTTPCRQAFRFVQFNTINDEFVAHTAQFNSVFEIQFFAGLHHKTAVAIIEYR